MSIHTKKQHQNKGKQPRTRSNNLRTWETTPEHGVTTPEHVETTPRTWGGDDLPHLIMSVVKVNGFVVLIPGHVWLGV